MSRPADRVRALASRLFAEQTIERVIDPILADAQCEYEIDVARGRRWRARLGVARGCVAFARALFWLGAGAACGPRSAFAHTCVVSAAASALMTTSLVIPPLLTWPRWHGDPVFTALLSVVLVPQALPLSMPAGLCVGVLWAMRGKAVTRHRVGAVLAIALALSTVVWIVLEWMMPQANQAFREMVAARLTNGRVLTLAPGLNELGLSRLGQRTDPAALRQYQLLWALCFASAPLGLLALGLAGYVRRAVSAVALATALPMSYFAIVWASASSAPGSIAPAAMPVWTANALFVLVACALLVRSRARNRVTSSGDRSRT